MKKSFEFIKERAALIEAQKRLHDAAEKETRGLNDAETLEFRKLQGEIEALAEKIKDAEAFEKNMRTVAKPGESVYKPEERADAPDAEAREKEKIYKRFSITKALREVSPDNEEKRGLSGAEKEVHEIGQAESRASGVPQTIDNATFSLPMSYMRATQQTVSQDSGNYGGRLVHDNAPRIVDPFRPRLFLEDLGATFITGITGGNLPLVVGTDFSMEWLAEGASITPQKKQFGGPVLSPKRAGGAVDITNRLLMQSSVDAENLIMNGLRRGFQNLLNAAAINGAGGVAPLGILQTTGISVSTQSAAGAATWASIVELMGLLETNDSTEQSTGYLIHPKLVAALMQIKKDAGSGLFLLDSGTIGGEKYASSSLVPTLDASGTPVYPTIYGDWSQLFIGQWGSINVKVNPYSADLADSVRLTLNTHADVAIANPKAFAVNNFISA